MASSVYICIEWDGMRGRCTEREYINSKKRYRSRSSDGLRGCDGRGRGRERRMGEGDIE